MQVSPYSLSCFLYLVFFLLESRVWFLPSLASLAFQVSSILWLVIPLGYLGVLSRLVVSSLYLIAITYVHQLWSLIFFQWRSSPSLRLRFFWWLFIGVCCRSLLTPASISARCPHGRFSSSSSSLGSCRFLSLVSRTPGFSFGLISMSSLISTVRTFYWIYRIYSGVHFTHHIYLFVFSSL